jgi:hypothetical protein
MRQHAEEAVRSMIEQVNAFYAGPWNDYKNVMQEVDVDPFKDYSPLRIE